MHSQEAKRKGRGGWENENRAELHDEICEL